MTNASSLGRAARGSLAACVAVLTIACGERGVPAPAPAATAATPPAATAAGAPTAVPARADIPNPEASPPPAAPAAPGPTLAARLAGVAKIRITRVAGVEPPIKLAKAEVVIAEPADVASFVAAIGPDQPAMDGGPRCLTALSAELLGADGGSKGVLTMLCGGGGMPRLEAVIRDQDPSRSWRFADPAAAQALLERLGN